MDSVGMESRWFVKGISELLVMSTLISLVTMAISNEPLLPTTSQSSVHVTYHILYTPLLAYYHLMAVHNSWALIVKAEVIKT